MTLGQQNFLKQDTKALSIKEKTNNSSFIKTKCFSPRNTTESEKASHRVGEYICKAFLNKGI